MNDAIRAIEEALATVEFTIDRLRTLGREEEAFRLAQLQFSSAIRASWPGNLAPLTLALGALSSDSTLALDDDDRARIGRAVETLKRACNQ